MATATLIDGKYYATRLRAAIAVQAAQLKADHGLTPGLAVVLVGEDPASQIYVRNKGLQAREAGMNSFEYRLPATATQVELLARIADLNQDPAVNGILVQLPLPKQIDPEAVIAAIAVSKDVDGFHPLNAGLLAVGGTAMVPCTPLGCLMLLRDYAGPLAGQRAVVLGRSNIVGKPMAALLLQEHCTVTIAHSRTRDLAEECRRADILVAAVGKAQMVKGDWIKPGATVVDVGINRIPTPDGKGRLVGDVDFTSAVEVAGAITPVPGGVGPMTIACLLLNTLTATCRQQGVPMPEVRPVAV
jgi:methylenetetrahydrofolate dehydrogenase (NADP+)/methenyltetrahydrofolate cyclohydrolase